MTFGDTHRIKGKGVFFHRTTPEGKPINVQNGNELDCLFGEIGAHPINTLETILTSTHVPFVRDFTAWGKCEDEQKSEFLSSVERFADDLTEAMTSLAGGVELEKPSKDHECGSTREEFDRLANEPETVAHYEKLVDGWITKIKGYIGEETSRGRAESSEAGPRTELDQWRKRN